jgi:hypothetical protein
MATYDRAVLVGGLSLAGRLPRLLPAAIGLAARVWAVALAPGVGGRVSPGEHLSYAMKIVAVFGSHPAR